MKSKKYVFELIVRESENLEKVCSTITACDYDFEELKERKVDNEILFCKDILLDQLPKKKLEKFIGAPQKNSQPTGYPPYPDILDSWDEKTQKEARKSYGKDYAFHHKPTKLWVYFLPNYDKRQIISLGLKNDATIFQEKDIEDFTVFLKASSFNGYKKYGTDNFLEFELKEV
jgi:hypothetical protein